MSERRQNGTFLPGTHWRSTGPHWDRVWLDTEYTIKGRSSSEIAREVGLKENCIHYWLAKHGIKTRTVSEARALKHWGAAGPANPMFGKTGPVNPNWKGGLTPLRQQWYSSLQWRYVTAAVRKRDRCCRLCGGTSNLEYHHVLPFRRFPLLVFEIGNIIRLCKRCHSRMRGKEMRWSKRLLALIAEGGNQYGG